MLAVTSFAVEAYPTQIVRVFSTCSFALIRLLRLLRAGNYDGPLCPTGDSCFPSLAEAINASNTGGTVKAWEWISNVTTAVALARAADAVVLVIDNAADGGGEGHDRHTIGPSADQVTLADAVLAANPNTIVVLINGGLISIDKLKDTAPGVIEAFMPGVHGGQAIAETIFGDNNPGGKLPVTMYHSDYVNVTDFLSMDMSNRSYRYYTGTPLYEFGFGLSYTTFDIKWDQPPPQTIVRGFDSPAASYQVNVTNTGAVPGDEVVLAFVLPHTSSLRTSLGADTPIEKKRLFGFQRVTLSPGESTTLTFDLEPAALAMVDTDGVTALHAGHFDIVFSRGHGEILSADASVETQSPAVLKALRKWW